MDMLIAAFLVQSADERIKETKDVRVRAREWNVIREYLIPPSFRRKLQT